MFWPRNSSVTPASHQTLQPLAGAAGRVDLHGPLQVHDRFVDPAGPLQGNAQVVLGQGVVGRKLDRPAQTLDRAGKVAGLH